ncbi:HAMP domain-containing sensor histidine kinase [Parasphingorhabdus sp. SCSIO 66989]|uniref:histidine kinase n=2 Tax=Alterisphingorhabdus coralli TaxID=3071408 RepID=A0AA97F4Q9_9SPHN|nr:HAMP domain-containing sensor histidine kinase [Parasphingorhabdus sp. SCSIO 66989]WOE74274.1 HAMP domain-containing sensor histidine kinase [Parasphingorhabdus sp. SCSIO 66989]
MADRDPDDFGLARQGSEANASASSADQTGATSGTEAAKKQAVAAQHTGSLNRRMISIAAAWILVLLFGGGLILDRILTNTITSNFDEQLEYVLNAMITSAEIGPDGEVLFNRPLGDQRFLEPDSGLYWQISGEGHQDFPSRSLWDRSLKPRANESAEAAYIYDTTKIIQLEEAVGDVAVDAPDRNDVSVSIQPRNDGVLRVIERGIYLPDSDTRWWFMVAQSRNELDEQLADVRRTIFWSFVVLGLGLIILATLQTFYGLWPLRRVRQAIYAMRTGQQDRVTDSLPREVIPMVDELNALLEHNETQAEEARRHAGNLAHALKTPLTVVMNAATAQADDLSDTVIREARVMRRQVDHHLARARAVGRRGHAHSRANVWQSVEAVERAVTRLYSHVRFDVDGKRDIDVTVERQDLDEILGNVIENAAKYGGGSVFVTVGVDNKDSSANADEKPMAEIWVEDDGMGIPPEQREQIFDRGARLDTGKPGTGLGLAIVRDVVEIYEGTVMLEESEDLGGLLVRLRLPLAG